LRWEAPDFRMKLICGEFGFGFARKTRDTLRPGNAAEGRETGRVGHRDLGDQGGGGGTADPTPRRGGGVRDPPPYLTPAMAFPRSLVGHANRCSQGLSEEKKPRGPLHYIIIVFDQSYSGFFVHFGEKKITHYGVSKILLSTEFAEPERPGLREPRQDGDGGR